MEERIYYTPVQIAHQLGIRKNTVYVLIKQGELPAIKIGNGYRVPKQMFEEWVRKTAVLQAEERRGA